ncbi:MAG: magnesium chelatase subunit H, partial [Anaerolineae bacterium]
MESLNFVYLTMDGGHNAALREAARLLERDHNVRMNLSLHSAATLHGPADWERLHHDMGRADFIFGCMIFGEEHVRPLQALLAENEAPVCFITSNPALIYETRIGKLSLKQPDPDEEQGFLSGWMQKLRPKKSGRSEGHRQTNLIKNLMKLMKYVPGKMRDLHTFVSAHDYWLHSSPENLERMMCLLIDRYVPGYEGLLPVEDPIEYPDAALYHPDAEAPFPDSDSYQRWRQQQGKPVGDDVGVVGVLTMRAIILSGNTAHLDTLIRRIEAQGLEARTAYSALLDFRPAMQQFFAGEGLPAADVVLNSMGFPLVGGPAGSRPDQAVEVLSALDVGYFDMIPLGFQRVEDWQTDDVGLNPMQVAMNIALPELDGSVEPVIFGGPSLTSESFIPLEQEADHAARRIARRIRLQQHTNAEKKIAVVLFNFPPNLGNAGTAAFLDVFNSLYRLLAEMKEAGYAVDVPPDVETLRCRIVEGNATHYGTVGNVADHLHVEDYRQRFAWYPEIETYWGYAPGELLTDGENFHIMGAHFGNVFVGLQPSFGYERDPMSLLMGKDASPHHGFAAFYTWLDQVYDADAVVHFGTHGALEFMPGKQTGISADCWPSRLLGALPNFYYYCVNNPSEGAIAKRRGAATLVSYMVPPLQQAGLYKGLRRLKDSIEAYQKRPTPELLADIRTQAEKLGIVVEAPDYIPALRHELIRVEQRMIPLGLHVLGTPPNEAELIDMLALVAAFNPAMHPNGQERLPTLPVLIAHGLGWDYQELQKAIKADPAAQETWERIDTVLHEAVGLFVRAPRTPYLVTAEVDAYLHQNGGIPAGLLANLWPWLDDVMDRIIHDEEIAGLLHSLNGGYIRPSPGNDVMRNDAIVPTGRNIHALDPYRVPSAGATAAAGEIVEQMLSRLVAQEGSL